MKLFCINCGKPFYPSPSFFPYQRFCSDECKTNFSERHSAEVNALLHSGRKLFEKKCAYCGKLFFSPATTGKFCSDEHKKLFHQLKKFCDSCGRPFVGDGNTCDKCRNNRDLEHAPKPKKKRESRFDLISRRAAECGLSYGIFQSQLRLGKTYEQLKADYERRNDFEY